MHWIVQTYSHAYYSWKESIDFGKFYASVDDGAKMKSRAAIYDFYDMDTTNMTEATCREIN